MTTTPTSSATTTVRDSITRPVVGRSTSKASSRALSSSGDEEAAADPDDRAEQPDRQRFDQHRGEDLAPRGAERAQHPELADPLGDGDREGVEDQEGADEDGDEAEDEQEGLQEAEACRGFLRSRGRRFPVPVSTRTPAGISRGDPAFQRRRRDAVGGGDRDLVEAADLVGERLRDRQRHLGDAGAAEGGAAELGEADELERPGARPARSARSFRRASRPELSAAALSIEASVGPRGRWPVDVVERLELPGQASRR